MINNARLLEIERLLVQEEEEIEEAKKISQEVLPIINKLTKSEILNPVILKVRLAKMNKKYRDIVYALFRIAVKSGPEGSFMILNEKKVMSVINEELRG